MLPSVPDAVLRSEHDSLRALLTALEHLAEGIRREDAFSKDDLYDVISVLSDFADRCHTGKEEKVLFPVLGKTSPEMAALVKRLTEDHLHFRGYIASIHGLVAKARTKAIRRRIASRLSTYARLHKEHMRVVDEDLLPQVPRLLPPDERDRIMRTFAHVEEREIGWGMKDAYVAIIRRLAETYRE
mgnify:CR=1 FL=1